MSMEIECQGDMDLDNGLDEHGYVLNRCSPQNIQREFQPLIVETINLLVSTFSNQIHSIYLYGSIARGEAVLYKSDLDISVIFHSPLVYAQQLQLEQLASIICRDFPIISKVDFDLGHVDEVMDSVEEYHWQFWLKHCCCCVWGNDLSVFFRKHRPSIQVSRAINSDLDCMLKATQAQLNTDNVAVKGKFIAKKLIRTSYSLVAEIDNSWHQSLERCARTVLTYEEVQSDGINQALAILDNDNSSVAEVTALIDGYGRWLVNRFANEFASKKS
ncbi:nucleotidyltransferase domain-containing protein [Photobacterium profundum]|uniref:nucleotidyltransferase domain-containing protein n=1 Tax=Photobacterium profundum TaxID=74109 RepID=UPI003D14D134